MGLALIVFPLWSAVDPWRPHPIQVIISFVAFLAWVMEVLALRAMAYRARPQGVAASTLPVPRHAGGGHAWHGRLGHHLVHRRTARRSLAPMVMVRSPRRAPPGHDVAAASSISA
jgi:hypothetical protein